MGRNPVWTLEFCSCIPCNWREVPALQAGGKDVSKLDQALLAAEEILTSPA
ncbi:MAG: hypothetical protein HUU16_17360 [Candidatus Omnitrophica bacterium]|nr:hypothetical protein [Candidatus Omnitrophota bacterium]